MLFSPVDAKCLRRFLSSVRAEDTEVVFPALREHEHEILTPVALGHNNIDEIAGA
jgi:hypothetical protein